MPKIQVTRVYTELQKAVADGFTVISEQGGTRSSKTYNTIIFLVMYLVARSGLLCSIVRKTRPSIKASCLRDFREIMQRLELWDDDAWRETDMLYTFPNGSQLEFFGADDQQKIRGRKRDILYCNEANELDLLEWKQLKMRTTRFSIVDYNPSMSDDHWLNELNKDPRTYFFKTTYKDNPFLEQTIIDEIESLKESNASLWQVYGLGEQAQIEGLVFPSFIEVDEIPASARHRFIGMDFGFTNDPTAIVDVGIDGNDLYIDEVCYRTHMLTSDIIDELRPYKDRKIDSESADQRLCTEIGRAGFNIFPVKKGQGSVEAGVLKMQSMRIHITRRSTNVRTEFKNYTFQQKKDGTFTNVPIDKYNHAIDAVRYVVLTEVMGGRSGQYAVRVH